MKLIYIGKVKEGSLRIYNRRLFDQDMAGHEGKEVRITVERNRKKRSNQQNRWYFGCIVPIIGTTLVELRNEEFRSKELTHEFLKMLFLVKEVINNETG